MDGDRPDKRGGGGRENISRQQRRIEENIMSDEGLKEGKLTILTCVIATH